MYLKDYRFGANLKVDLGVNSTAGYVGPPKRKEKTQRKCQVR